jgi:hypothetical protein
VPVLSANASILLFHGTGTSPEDVRAIETLLYANHLSYSTGDSSGLNGMPGSKFKKYRLLIVPALITGLGIPLRVQ